MDEVMSRGMERELEAGRWEGTRFYLVHACRCCLVTERKQIESRKQESTSPFLFLALRSFTIQAQAAHKHTTSLCLHFRLRHSLSKKPRPSSAVTTATVLLPERPRGGESRDTLRQKSTHKSSDGGQTRKRKHSDQLRSAVQTPHVQPAWRL